jgi:hypothetical protein
MVRNANTTFGNLLLCLSIGRFLQGLSVRLPYVFIELTVLATCAANRSIVTMLDGT